MNRSLEPGTYQFWRPALLALGIGICVIGACAILQRFGLHAPADEFRKLGVFSSLQLPDPGMQPAEVIRTQIEALRDTRSPGVGALQCYCFAAPTNRIVTGPLPRFARMVRGAPFASLGESQAYSVGDPQFSDVYASSLVVTVGDDRSVRAFHWVLRKHQDPPFTDCWLTIGVFLTHESLAAPETPSPGDEWL